MKIAMTGISGAGKDYLVDHLVKNYGYARLSFSTQLKRLASIIYPWLEEDYPPFEKEQPLNLQLDDETLITHSPRDIWIHLNKLRDIDPKVFLRSLEDEMRSLDTDKIVISDIRPQVEWDWCRENGFTSVYIDPSKKVYEPNDFDSNIPGYADQADYIFTNNHNGTDEFDTFIRRIQNAN